MWNIDRKQQKSINATRHDVDRKHMVRRVAVLNKRTALFGYLAAGCDIRQQQD